MKRGARDGPLGIVWEGSFFVYHSLANVNREVAVLLAQQDVDLGLIPYEPHQFDARADPRYSLIARRLHHEPATVHCHVRHRWPPDLSRPRRGAFILCQPWEYGFLPRTWVNALKSDVDEAWVYTAYVRDSYRRSGVPSEKIAVIPLGVNSELFHARVPPARLNTRKSFKFLFVGGGILRKGFDVLLDAYTEEFTSADDVCLVVRDFFYGGAARHTVRWLERRRNAPEILYSYGTLNYCKLGGLYTACDCYVHPYRSEGFGLPIVEAMACGLPVIVTGWGASLDFCNDALAYLVPAEERRVPRGLWPRSLPTVGPPTWCEPDKAALRRLMRHVFENRAEARRKGTLASAHVLTHFTWQRTVAEMLERMQRWRRPRDPQSRRVTGSHARTVSPD